MTLALNIVAKREENEVQLGRIGGKTIVTAISMLLPNMYRFCRLNKATCDVKGSAFLYCR